MSPSPQFHIFNSLDISSFQLIKEKMMSCLINAKVAFSRSDTEHGQSARSLICSGKHSDICHHLSFHLRCWFLHRFQWGFDLSEFQSTGIWAHTRGTCENLWYHWASMYQNTLHPPRDTITLSRTVFTVGGFKKNFFFCYNVNFCCDLNGFPLLQFLGEELQAVYHDCLNDMWAFL